MCGEHDPFATTLCASLGSSPRVRGTLEGEWDGGGRSGIIPACAGNTSRRTWTSCMTRDHPRVCGEHSARRYCRGKEWGSSPRVRGTRDDYLGQDEHQGIIPACAGNTATPMRHEASPRDHPRVCGEHPRWLRGSIIARGSSPRVRGTPCPLVVQVQRTGIIPACAGNTAGSRRAPAASRDHPRVCGEHLIPHLATSFGVGSSPRVRGTPEAFDAFMPYGGIIPACAGNTVCGEFSSAAWGDHPRVCGEHWASA